MNDVFCEPYLVPLEYTWIIPVEKLMAISDDGHHGKGISSEGIKLKSENSNIQFCLELTCDGDTPDGSSSMNDDMDVLYDEEKIFTIYLWLMNVEEDAEVHRKFSINVKSAGFSAECNALFAKTEGWGKELCTVDDLFQKKFVVNGEMVVEIKGCLMFEPPKLEEEEPCGFAKLLWKDQEFKDFDVIIGDESYDQCVIKVHKTTLALRSPVFKAIIQSEMSEGATNCIQIIDYSYRVVKSAIEFCYGRDSFKNLPFDDVNSLLHFAYTYEIGDLIENVEILLTYHLSHSNVCRLANAAIATNSELLRELCFEFLQICLRQSTTVNDFDMLDKDFAMELLKKSLAATECAY